jgi:hypothetical protein
MQPIYEYYVRSVVKWSQRYSSQYGVCINSSNDMIKVV